MRPLVADPFSWTAGPDFSTSLCDMTSLFANVSVPLTPRLSVWLGLKAAPFSDQLWQTWRWGRITSDALPGAAEATEAAVSATASRATELVNVRLRFTMYFLPGRVVSTVAG